MAVGEQHCCASSRDCSNYYSYFQSRGDLDLAQHRELVIHTHLANRLTRPCQHTWSIAKQASTQSGRHGPPSVGNGASCGAGHCHRLIDGSKNMSLQLQYFQPTFTTVVISQPCSN